MDDAFLKTDLRRGSMYKKLFPFSTLGTAGLLIGLLSISPLTWAAADFNSVYSDLTNVNEVLDQVISSNIGKVIMLVARILPVIAIICEIILH